MNKQELLKLANKGPQTYDGITFEVITFESCIGGEILTVKIPGNDYSEDAIFGEGWHEYYTDQDVADLFPAMHKAIARMEEQSRRHNLEPIKFKNLHKEDNYCNHLIKRLDNNEIYVIQEIRNKEQICTAFQVLTACKWSQGYEPNAPINVPIVIDGVLYKPSWSFWLDSAIYKLS